MKTSESNPLLMAYPWISLPLITSTYSANIGRTLDKVNESVFRFRFPISLSIDKASLYIPFCAFPAITVFQETTSLFGIISKTFLTLSIGTTLLASQYALF
ncbi:hypothetical protein TorRG33x02_092980 [Trema orientale]|uniref:Uncharacterized protein n=1 Tax=Trema orientale TaxID=63057 RepID=A0A2P5FAH5_TREOI|nr:hypothetical protein TorRG33x02_092980 [Trema orientale]